MRLPRRNLSLLADTAARVRRRPLLLSSLAYDFSGTGVEIYQKARKGIGYQFRPTIRKDLSLYMSHAMLKVTFRQLETPQKGGYRFCISKLMIWQGKVGPRLLKCEEPSGD